MVVKYPPFVYAVKENSRTSRDARIHIVTRPAVLDTGGRNQLLSFQAWREREIAQHSAHVEGVLAPPRWRHADSMFFDEPYDRWISYCELLAESMQKYPDWIDQRDLPRTEHASVWDFFAAIGWDRKKKRYV